MYIRSSTIESITRKKYSSEEVSRVPVKGNGRYYNNGNSYYNKDIVSVILKDIM